MRGRRNRAVSPGALTLAYAGGVALGAVFRRGYPGGVANGVAVGLLCLFSASLPTLRSLFGRRRTPPLPSWYRPSLREAGASFWRPSPARQGRSRAGLLAGLAVLGLLRTWQALDSPPPGLAELVRDYPAASAAGRVLLRGTAVAGAEPLRDGWAVVVRPDGRAGVNGLVRLTVSAGWFPGPGKSAAVRAGTRLEAPVRLTRPEPANPGEEPFDGIAAEGRLAALAWAKQEQVSLVGWCRPSPAALLRQRLSAFLGSGTTPEAAGMLRALLLGDRSGLSATVEEDFARAGAAHLLVVSGLHLSVMAALLGGAAARCGLGRRSQAVVSAVAALGYATLTGWRPPVARAALMTLAGQGAGWLGRPHDGGRALGAAVLLMLALRPLLLFDAGFRLSVAATWGVVTLAPALAGASGAGDLIGRGWCVSLGAQLATAPVLLSYFGRVPLLAILASPVLVCCGAVLVEVECLGSAAGLAMPALGRPLSAGLGAGALMLRWLAQVAGRIPLAGLNLPGAADWVAALYYLVLAAGFSAWTKRGSVGFSGKSTAPARRYLPWLAGSILLAAAASGRSPTLRATFLSVGEADALHLRLPGGIIGPNLMVDAGRSPGRPRLYLRRAAVQGLAAVVVTHAHQDHAGGVAGLNASFSPPRIIGPGPEGYEAVTLSGVAIRITPSSGGGKNEASRRVLLRYGRFYLLTSGDAPLAEGDPVLKEVPLRGTPGGRNAYLVVKVPHHGARDAFSPGFIHRYRPNLAVVSVGPNGYGHPDPSLIAFLRREGIPVLRTDVSGAITLATDGRRVTLKTHRLPGRRELLEVAHDVGQLDVRVKGGVQPTGDDLGDVVDEEVDLSRGDDQVAQLRIE